jgi:hypothetical protein
MEIKYYKIIMIINLDNQEEEIEQKTILDTHSTIQINLSQNKLTN